MPLMRPQSRGFTLVEILVVVGIIGVLMGLVLPAVKMVQNSSRATVSQSNLKQWGTAVSMYADQRKGRLPWEGKKGTGDMETNLAEPTYWATALPAFLGELPYSAVIDEALRSGLSVPVAPDAGSIFVDPGAVAEAGAPWEFGATQPNGARKAYYFNYVPNSQLNNTYLAQQGQTQNLPKYAMPMSTIGDASSTVLMLEMRANKSELPGSDPNYDLDLDRHRCDWKRFAARHSSGGHFLFADSHVAHKENRNVITNSTGTTTSTPTADYNQVGLIWDPLGPATD